MVLLPEDMTLQEIIGRLSALAEHSNPKALSDGPEAAWRVACRAAVLAIRASPGEAPSEGYDQAALDDASRELHMFFLREGSSYGTKACEEIGRVFMTAYLKCRSRSEQP